jgi:hypothetical protein
MYQPAALSWFHDRVTSALPQPLVLSVSLWFYKAAMLAWALWLSFALVRWVRWPGSRTTRRVSGTATLAPARVRGCPETRAAARVRRAMTRKPSRPMLFGGVARIARASAARERADARSWSGARRRARVQLLVRVALGPAADRRVFAVFLIDRDGLARQHRRSLSRGRRRSISR